MLSRKRHSGKNRKDRQADPADSNPYRAYLARRREAERPVRRDRKDGTYYQVFPSDLAIMSKEQADYLGHLVNFAQTKADDDGRFVCMPRLQLNGLGLCLADDRRILDALVARRFADYQWEVGGDGRRCRLVRVLVGNIERALVGKAIPAIPAISVEPTRPGTKRKWSKKEPYAGLHHLGFGLIR